MKLSTWLCFALLGAVACGSDDGASSPGASDHDPSSPAEPDEGGRRDGGVRRDGGNRNPPGTGSTASGANTCEKLELTGRPNAPHILIVLDRSGSMVGLGDPRNRGKNRWRPSVSAVKALTSELTDTVAFGLMLFPAAGAGPGGDWTQYVPGLGGGGGGAGPGCEPGVIDVEVETGSADEIAQVLDRSAPDTGATPTAATLMAARAALDVDLCSDCVEAPKYVLLVTDGQPTCGASGQTNSSPDDIAATNAALDELSEAGISTYVIGYDTASDPAAADAMNQFAMHGGTGTYLPVEDEQTLLTELTKIAGALVPCEYELTMDIPDPSYVRVEIDGVTYKYMEDWHVEGRKIILEPSGGACPVLRDAKLHVLKITRECEIVIAI